MFDFENIRYIGFALFLFIVFFVLLFIYYSNIRRKTNLIKIILLTLRLFSFSLLMLLLINPTFKKTTKSKLNNHISIYIDNSQSITNNIEQDKLLDYVNNITNHFKENQIISDIYIFGDTLIKINNLNDVDFSNPYTNISSVFKDINSKLYESIIITDGDINSGDKKNTLYKNNIVNIFNVNNDKQRFNEDIYLESINIKESSDSILINLAVISNLISNRNELNIFISDDQIKYDKIGSINLVKGRSLKNTHNVTLDKAELSFVNYIKIESIENEDIRNNLNYFIFDHNDIKLKKVLLVTGALSTNTQVIKKIIHLSFPSLEYNHIFRINDKLWNKDLSLISQSKYDVIVFDNFPIYNADLPLISKFNNENIISFLGPNNNYIYHKDFLNKYGYEIINNDINLEYILDKESVNSVIYNLVNKIPPVAFKSHVKSKNKGSDQLFMYSTNGVENLILDKTTTKLFVFIADLFNFEYLANLNNATIFDLLGYYVKTMINNDDHFIRLETLYSNYNENEEVPYIIKSKIPLDDISELILYVNDGSNLRTYNVKNYKIVNNTIYLNHIFDKTGDFDVFLKLVKSDYTEVSSETKKVSINSNSIENITVPNSSDYLKSIVSKINGKYDSIENIETFLNLYTKKTSNYYNKIERFNVYTFQEYWLLLIFLLIVEWYIRKTRGLV